MEELLTADEITSVLIEAEQPEFKIENLFHFTSRKLNVSKVSRKGLIFIHGDERTGMEHIQLRHSVTSRKLFEKDGIFDNPTKFNLAPIEYPFVADAIFVPENLNNNKNKRPDLFDCYIGEFKHKDGNAFKYTLILYKSVKIVHTFFLSNTSKPFNKKVKLPIRQGWCGSSHDLMSGLQEYSIHYKDISNVTRFTIFLRCIPKVKLEKWYLTVNDINGISVFTHYLHDEVMTVIFNPPMRMGMLDFQDLSAIERKIKKIIENSYEFEKDFNKFSNFIYLS